MIRTIRRLIATDGGDNKEWVELTMLSSDTKPTSGIINGSIATEMDTGSVFFFDEAAGEWIEQFSFQNAGGGGGGGGIYTVVISIIYNPDTGEMTASVTKGDFATAIQKVFAFEPIYVWVCMSDLLAGLDTVGTGAIESFNNSYIELSVLNAQSALIWNENGIEFEGP